MEARAATTAADKVPALQAPRRVPDTKTASATIEAAKAADSTAAPADSTEDRAALIQGPALAEAKAAALSLREA